MKKKVAISLIASGTALLVFGGVIAGIVLAWENRSINLIDGLIPEKEFKENSHISIDTAAETDEFSLVYNNSDGTKTLYVFATPVQYLKDGKYQLIDNALTDSENGYLFENKSNDIKTFYPDMKNQKDLLLQFGEKKISMQPLANQEIPQKQNKTSILGFNQEMVQYYEENGVRILYFTTNLGLKCHIEIEKPVNVLEFAFDLSTQLTMDSSNPRYFLFRDEFNQTAGILYQPVILDKNGEVLAEELAEITPELNSEESAKFHLSISPTAEKKQYPLTAEFTLNMYKGNQVDSSINSRNPNSNQYLENYLYIGADQQHGEAESYIRFETNVMDNYISQYDIRSIDYLFYGLNKQKSDLSLYQCDAHWSSTKITWNTRQRFETELKPVEKETGIGYRVDVMELVKQWPNSHVLQDNGFMLKAKPYEWEAVASADNGYMGPRVRANYVD